LISVYWLGNAPLGYCWSCQRSTISIELCWNLFTTSVDRGRID